MFRWLNGPGSNFRGPLPGSTNYLGAYDRNGQLIRSKREQKPQAEGELDAAAPVDDELGSLDGEGASKEMNIAGGMELARETLEDLRPFPLNRQFRSQHVLSEELREEIWKRVVQVGKSVKVVSAELGVEMNRVGAVVRLKSVEKEWAKKGNTFAAPYASAILSMLPQTPYNANAPSPHESINDLPTHQATVQQIFHPVAESRSFTRADSALVFSPTLLPADQRIPHPELIGLEKERLEGVPREERIRRQRERTAAETKTREEKEARRRAREEKTVKRVRPAGGRWEFRFTDVRVEEAGRDGRGVRGVGSRYGIPNEDRKRGQVKIPTRVE
ncbi:MAG: hypothetical protein M1827_004531 [Pycnora praestabilis]|nr:MAG: hypothetical protein M1827_004531 [Pycnora praestabilis]